MTMRAQDFPTSQPGKFIRLAGIMPDPKNYIITVRLVDKDGRMIQPVYEQTKDISWIKNDDQALIFVFDVINNQVNPALKKVLGGEPEPTPEPDFDAVDSIETLLKNLKIVDNQFRIG